MANFGRGLLAGFQVGNQAARAYREDEHTDEIRKREREEYKRRESDRKLLEEARMQSGEPPAAAGVVDDGQIPMSAASAPGPARRGVEVTPADMPMAPAGKWSEPAGASINEVPPMTARPSAGAPADGAPAQARPARGMESNMGPGRAGTIPAEPQGRPPQPAAPVPAAPQSAGQAPGMPKARTFDDLDSMNRSYQAQVQYLMGKNRPDLALPIMVQGAKIREAARGAAFDRARQQAEMTGDVNAYVPFINNYVQAGFQLKNIRQTGEDYVLDGTGPDGKDFSKPVKAADMQRYLKFIADPAAQRALEARMAEETHKAALEMRKEREKNRMQKVGQGETLVDTVGGGSFTAPAGVKTVTRKDAEGNEEVIFYDNNGVRQTTGSAGGGLPQIPKAVGAMRKETTPTVFKLNGVSDMSSLDPGKEASVRSQLEIADALIGGAYGTDNWQGMSPSLAATIAHRIATDKPDAPDRLVVQERRDPETGETLRAVEYRGRLYFLSPGGVGQRGPAMRPSTPGPEAPQKGASAGEVSPAQISNVARSYGLDDRATRLALSIFEQESGSGRADTSQANYAGARGPMQVTKDTFEGLKREGLIPSDWQHDNPAHTTAAGVRLIARLNEQYDGDPMKVAAAYYSGPKAIAADGTIKNLRDPKNPKAPTTHQYVRQVMARIGRDVGDGRATGQPVAESVTPQERAGRRLDAARQARVAAREALNGYGSRQQRNDPNGFRAAKDALQKAEQELRDAQVVYESALGPMTGQGFAALKKVPAGFAPVTNGPDESELRLTQR
jgi:hypothetical protein